MSAAAGTTVYLDTVFDFFERSADGVRHVANFGNGAPLYSRYVCGTNENYTDIAQHFDFPSPSNEQAVITKVEILGFRAWISLNGVVDDPDTITWRYYNADANGYPTGDALASSTYLSRSIQNRELDFFLPDNEAVEITSRDGFVVNFETFKPGNDDVLVISNSYCVVQDGPNDGRGERRLKGLFVSDDQWHDVIELYSFVVDLRGNYLLHRDLGVTGTGSHRVDISNLAGGAYFLLVQSGATTVKHNFIVRR